MWCMWGKWWIYLGKRKTMTKTVANGFCYQNSKPTDIFISCNEESCSSRNGEIKMFIRETENLSSHCFYHFTIIQPFFWYSHNENNKPSDWKFLIGANTKKTVVVYGQEMQNMYLIRKERYIHLWLNYQTFSKIWN